MTLEDIRREIEAAGLAFRGGFHPDTDDLAGERAKTLVLIGAIGRENRAAFAASAEARDGRPDPLDRWSRRIIDGLAAKLGAHALFPFGGPPFLPFQRWAQKAETLYPSPLGMLIHPVFGLWHSWRGALAFETEFDLPPRDARPSPCETCRDKPCLTACPVGAFSPAGYDVRACVSHLDSKEGADCMDEGCRARRACPIGTEYRYGADQAAFHMKAFRAAQKRSA